MSKRAWWHLWFQGKEQSSGEYVPMPSKRIRGAGVVEVSASDLLKSKKVQQHFEIAKRLVDNQARLDSVSAQRRRPVKQAG